VLSEDDYKQRVRALKLDEGNKAARFWDRFSATLWTGDELAQRLAPHFPLVNELRQKWDQATPLSHLELTTVGFAIAHANLTRLGIISADLRIWIP
jgi:hypothetical protein